jgi:hypothetical protein
VALLVLSTVALALVLRNLDIAGIADGFGERTPVRPVAAVLDFLAAGLGGMWISSRPASPASAEHRYPGDLRAFASSTGVRERGR